MHNDNVLTEPRDAIARSKRILALVDEYHENPTRDTRTVLRVALMDEFQPEPRAEVTDDWIIDEIGRAAGYDWLPEGRPARDENTGCFFTYGELIDLIRTILAASPVEQPAAVPIYEAKRDVGCSVTWTRVSKATFDFLSPEQRRIVYMSPIPAPASPDERAAQPFGVWFSARLDEGSLDVHDRKCAEFVYESLIEARASSASETCVGGVRPVPPRWYSRDEILHALKNMNYCDTIALELADWFVRHLQLAFNKGFEKRARAPAHAAPVVIPSDCALVPGDPVHQQLTAICQSYWGDGWDDEDMREARLVDARAMYKAAIGAAPQPHATSPSDEG